MESILYQIIFNKKVNFEQELNSLLNELLDENYEFKEWVSEYGLKLRYIKQINEREYIIGFEISLNIIYDNEEEKFTRISAFLNSLSDKYSKTITP